MVEQRVQNEILLFEYFSRRLKDNYLQTWNSTLENSTSLHLYKNIKSTYEYETYFSILTARKFRYCYAQLRSGLSHLEIIKGKYHNVVRESCICKICSLNCIEDEFHFLLICPVYTDIRYSYIPKKFYINATTSYTFC